MAPLLLDKRDYCYGYGCSSGTWGRARWILFVLFVLLILLVIISTIRVNRRRRRDGLNPIRGTAWITPPSYLQSQRQQQQEPPYVPQYTETTNDNDLGYYDANGNFHANHKATEAYHLNNLVQDQTGVSNNAGGSGAYQYQPPPGPPPAAVHTTGADENHDFQRDFARYYGSGTATTNTTTTNTNSGNDSSKETSNENSDEIVYQRPDAPPPSHVKN